MSIDIWRNPASIVSPTCAAAALFALAGMRYAEPIWAADHSVILVGALVSLAFIAGHVLLWTVIGRGASLLGRCVRIAAIALLVSSPVSLLLLLAGIEVSGYVVLAQLVALTIVLFVNSYESRAVLAANFLLLLIGLSPALPGFGNLAFWIERELDLGGSADFVIGRYHDIKITNHSVPRPDQRPAGHLPNGGALEHVDDDSLLLVTGWGGGYLLHLVDDKITVETLPLRVPINVDAYVATTDRLTRYFRVTDVALEPAATWPRKLYAAHHYLDTDNNCYTLRVSETELNLDTPAPGAWVTRFSSTPCLHLEEVKNTTGGRLAFLDDTSILMTLGDHSHKLGEVAADESFLYGKTLRLDLNDWTFEVFTSGHRNPQGLWVEKDRIWLTEHGPNGGDELNLLEPGVDYGWPLESYGTDYGRQTFAGDTPGVHTHGRRPLYAWFPSIGVSNLIRLKGSMFPSWKDDLLIASLWGKGHGTSLFRLRVREDRVITIERLETHSMIRDLLEMPDGRIVLWDDRGTVQVLESTTHVFSKCEGCHAVRHRVHGVGPDLMDIVGRRVADRADFPYSTALRALDGRWTLARLDAFLADPSGTVPGTTMDVEGIRDTGERKEIIKYLQRTIR